jgi:acetyl esterase/lipase
MGQPTSIDPTERVSSRPDFAILVYPVISMMDPITHVGSRQNLLGEAPDPKLVELLSNERQVTAQTPSTFLFHTTDDPVVPVENSLEFFAALKKAGVPGTELHVFAHGAHGVGLASQDPALSLWTKLCELWMQGRGLL